MITTILFDLDGTLVDTAPDLAHALNLQLIKHGKTPLAYEAIRPFASHGSRGLVGLGFGVLPHHDNFTQMRDEYLSIYGTVNMRSPMLLPGIADLLQAIETIGITWGIVTNKPRRFTENLIESMGLNLQNRAACIVCGDDAPQPKPSPATLLMACEQIGVKPENCIYVGDAERDITAGKAAGMKTVVALFGYIDVTDKPAEWGAHVQIGKPLSLLNYIDLEFLDEVLTEYNFHDNPRLGVAQLNGVANIFESIFDTVADEYTDDYYLSPIDEDLLAFVLEHWVIWCRWNTAFNAKQTTLESHPALPEDLKRHFELVHMIGELKSNPNNRQQYLGVFSSYQQGTQKKFKVIWVPKQL